MLNHEERNGKKVILSKHVMQQCQLRGPQLFGTDKFAAALKEAIDHVRNIKRCAIFPDNDPNHKGTHMAVFKTNIGQIVAMALGITDTHITGVTILERCPQKHIREYYRIGKLRGIEQLPGPVPAIPEHELEQPFVQPQQIQQPAQHQIVAPVPTTSSAASIQAPAAFDAAGMQPGVAEKTS